MKTVEQRTRTLRTVKVGDHSWFDIDWLSSHEKVKQLQMMIAAAWVEGNLEQVKAKQKRLVHSFAAKAIAVKIVTSNPGKITPGVDGVIWDSPS